MILNLNDLSADNGARLWEGYQYGDINASLILIDLPPGGGPRLHRHPYEEVFVVHDGYALYTVGSTTIEVRAGQVVIVPKGVPTSLSIPAQVLSGKQISTSASDLRPNGLSKPNAQIS